MPAIPLAELNQLTSNFGQKALIGEGSYSHVFYASLSIGEPAAIKKLDPNASQEPDTDFAAQRKGVQGAEPGPVLSWGQRVKIAYGAARGLEYLHEKLQPPIVHRKQDGSISYNNGIPAQSCCTSGRTIYHPETDMPTQATSIRFLPDVVKIKLIVDVAFKLIFLLLSRTIQAQLNLL